MTSTMVRLEGGVFRRGSTRFYPEEGPIVETTVAPFEIDVHAVTNRDFSAFVVDTGYVTVAERPLDPVEFPGVPAGGLLPGSLVFQPTPGPVDLSDWQQWWSFEGGACWHRPRGPQSRIDGFDDHPVVQIAYEDAVTYAAWAEKRLPTEAEWEFAARGGLDQAAFTWGNEDDTAGAARVNRWHGEFPWRNDRARNSMYTAPVGSFPSNGYGLHEMTGNTWEWTSTTWTSRHDVRVPQQECACGCGPVGPASSRSRVIKGGSHLCSPTYCLRYRPAARARQTEDSATTHLGFRCARDV